jgi:endonuclease/exonuclease/phosphatase family metal-dependent hydrolase
MTSITIYNLGFRRPAGILLLALLLFGVAASGAPLRVTTWNIEPKLPAATNGDAADNQKKLIQETAEVLKKLHPDVIVLQGVPDWTSCGEIVKALKPMKYNVAAWSSFRDADTRRLSGQQTAILARNRAYISWSEAWKNGDGTGAPGGFAFAAIKIGGRNAGFVSVQMGGDEMTGESGRTPAQQLAREHCAAQLATQIDSLKKWTTNRIRGLVVGGDFNTGRDELALAGEKTLQLLEDDGLADAFEGLPLAKRVTVPGSGGRADATADYIFTSGIKPVAAPEIIATALTQHFPVTCDLDLETPSAPTPAPATAPEPVQVAQATSAPPVEVPVVRIPAPQTNAAASAPPVTEPRAIVAPGDEQFLRNAAIAAGGVLLLVAVWMLARRRRAEHKTSVVMTMRSGEGLVRALPGTAERIIIAPQSVDTTGSAAEHPPTVHIETAGAAEARMWRERAEEAERRAARAQAVVRHGLLGQMSEWLKGKIAQKLVSDRSQLMEAQQRAAMKMLVVDERLAKIEGQLQERYRAYERRIEELEKELAEAQEEKRELIRAKIALVKAEMEKERAQAARRSKEQGN